MRGIFHLLGEMTHFCVSTDLIPMRPLGSREGGGDRSRMCKSKTAKAKLLAFSEHPHLNSSLKLNSASFSKLNSIMTGTS